ncbi:MAG: helix-turn-helix domain-containing protein [Alphaproteobacteria bacterium]|nr:helix-turn-helix domain-containing protein [Alphaproteobacteria bacterium]
MDVSVAQIRAARGLLGWGQKDLAAEIGISAIAMNHIESGQSQPRTSTLGKIRNVFETNGVEFTEGHGVRLKEEVFKVDVYQGADATIRYYKDIVETLRRDGGEALHITFDESIFWKEEKDRKALFFYYKEFMRYGLGEKLILSETANQRYGPKQTSEYRVYSKDVFSDVSTSVYGMKYAIILPRKIITVQNPEVADTYRRQFLDYWKRAKPIAPRKSMFEEDMEKER